MARFTFQMDAFGHTPITVEAASEEEALAGLHSMPIEDLVAAARQSLEHRAHITGILPADIEAILNEGQIADPMEKGQVGHHEEYGWVDKFFLGVRHTLTSRARATQQILRSILPDDIADRMYIPSADELEKEEINARRLFAEIDKGIGMEDLGELIPDMLAFVGAGAVGIGLKALGLGVTTGGLLGALTPTVGEESRGVNATIGAVAGTLAPIIGTTVGGLVKVLSSGLGATAQMGAMLVGLGKGNAQVTAIAAGRMFARMGDVRATAARAVTASQAAGETAKGAITARVVSNRAMNEMGGIVRLMNRSTSTDFARMATQEAVGESFDAAFQVGTDGVLKFMPQVILKGMSRYTRADLRKLGVAGERMHGFREWVRTLVDLEDADPKMVRNALERYWTSSQARTLAGAMSRSIDPNVKSSLLVRMSKGAGMTLVRSAGAAPSAAVGQGGIQMIGQ